MEASSAARAAGFRERYAYRPVLLEAFVDERFMRACRKAANWVRVGRTQGRGKLDRLHEAELPRKSIWLYPPTKTFSRTLKSG